MTGDFLNKTKKLILVTADVVGLYPSIPHEAGLRGLREARQIYSYRRFG